MPGIEGGGEKEAQRESCTVVLEMTGSGQEPRTEGPGGEAAG